MEKISFTMKCRKCGKDVIPADFHDWNGIRY